MFEHVSTYFVNISRASSSYCCPSSTDTESKVSSFIKVFEHVSTYFVNISRASSLYCCLSSADTESKVSSFDKGVSTC